MTNNLMTLAKQANSRGSVQRIPIEDTFAGTNDIAIIGLAGSVGDANELSDFCYKVMHNYDFVMELPEERRKQADTIFETLYPNIDAQKMRYMKGGYMSSIDVFDYDFFGIPFIEAETMDPVQRAIFQTTIKALWDAGYKEKQLNNSKTGVFVGNSNTATETYKQYLMKCDDTLKNISLAGNLTSVLSSRISYYLNLKGTSVVVDTACSSGLAALHLACIELSRGECNLAIVAGAKINLLPPIMQKEDLGICSADGYTRTFDLNSQGTGIGEGVISLILKPLQKAKEDRDNIYAIIKGSALNQDGKSVGITAPNVQSQADLLMTTWRKSNVDPEKIQYVEAHGTATKLGDVVEIEAITKAFRQFTNKRQFCAIGSVKSNVGHTDAISGLVGLVKCIFAINEKKIPATLHFESPNRAINFIDSPVYVNERCREWQVKENEKRTCCVSSFGLSGTNVCVVLQEYKPSEKVVAVNEPRTAWISAKNEKMLEKIIKMYYSYVTERPDINLQDFTYTLNCRRNRYKYITKISFTCYQELLSGLREAIDALEAGQSIMDEGSEWNAEVFSIGDEKCISLPMHPFEERHCFLVPPKVTNRHETFESGKRNDLVPHLLFNSIKENVYEIEISTTNQWELGEHSVNDKFLLVGTSYLEIISQIAREYYGINKVRIYDMILLKGLIASDDKSIKLQIYVQKEKGTYQFEMYSSQDDQSVCHCKGKFGSTVPKRIDPFDVNSILSQIDNTQIITPEIYLYGQIRISDRWHVTNRIYFGSQYYVTHISIPQKYRTEAEEYVLYPTLMDAALNFSNTIQGEGTYLPWQYGNIEIYDNIPAEIYSFVKIPNDVGNKEVLQFNIDLVDKEGKVVASVHDYTVKRVDFQKESFQYDFHFSKRRWVEMTDDDYSKCEKKKTLLFSCKNRELPQYLDEYQRLVFDCSLSEGHDDFEKRYEDIYLNFICRMKELLDLRPPELKEICVVNNNGYSINKEPVVNYYGAALAAGMKSLRYEYPNYDFRYVDFDGEEKESLLDKLDIDTNVISLAIRNGKYYREEIISVSELPEKSEIVIQKEGVYIVTGGLGGVGLTIADALSKSGATRIVLAGRSKYSDLDASGKAPYTDQTTKSELFQKMQERGTLIEYVSMDVSDRTQIYSVLETIVQKYGTIKGIVHSAGISGEGLFFKKSVQDIQTVLDCKVKGLTYIDSFMTEKDLSLDFLMVCSSFTALAGAIGQWDYSVANEYLNAYCNYKNASSGCRYISAVWPTWDESGMALRHGFKREECIFLPISNEAGKEYFNRLISSADSETIAGKWNHELLSGDNLKMNIRFHNKKISKIESIAEDTERNNQANDDGDISVRAIKAQLLKLWMRVLGRDDIDEDDKFFETEGNSILATYLLSEINQVYGDILDITDIFTYSSINVMAEMIYKKLSKKKSFKEDDDLDALLQSLIDGKVTVDDIKMKV